MNIRKLDVNEHDSTRGLWEEVFTEDTDEFLNYYYQFMTNHNEIYTIEDEKQFVSMIHLNPYQVELMGKLFPIHYIVGVATKQEYRRRGLMGQLLHKVLQDLYQKEEPLTYLMPASESIYTPYGFVVVGEQVHYEYTGDFHEGWFSDKEQELEFVLAKEEDCAALADFANEEFHKHCVVFTRRSEAYFLQLLKEQACQNGGVVLVKKHGDMMGYFITANEGYQQVREMTMKDNIQISVREKERIPMMARATCVETLLLCTDWHAGQRHEIQVIDPIIDENTGTYQISPSYGGLKGRKISKEVDMEQAITISELTSRIMSYPSTSKQVLLNEIV